MIDSNYNPLGILRIAAVTYLLFFALGDRMGFFLQVEGLAPEVFTQNYFLRHSPLPFPLPHSIEVGMGKTILGAFKTTFFVVGLMAGIGLFTRPALLAFAAISLYMNAGIAATTQFNHESVLSQHLLIILALVPGTKSLSLDAFISSLRSHRQSAKKANRITPLYQSIVFAANSNRFIQLRREERWGIYVVLMLFFIVYLTAGLSKLTHSDGDWWDGNTLTYYLGREVVSDYWISEQGIQEPTEKGKPPVHFVDHTYGFEITPFGQALASSATTMVTLSIATLLWELCPFLLFVSVRMRNVYLLISVAMHFGIGLTMGLPFWSYQLYLLILVDWPNAANDARSIALRLNPSQG